VERAEELAEQAAGIGINSSLEALIEKYGEEAGSYLHAELTSYTRSYSKLTFIQTGLEVDGSFRQRAQDEAEKKGWKFEDFAGSTALIRRLTSGDWKDDFLVVPPGYRIVASYDDGIVDAVSICQPETESSTN
jgi:hypothetical protein